MSNDLVAVPIELVWAAVGYPCTWIGGDEFWHTRTEVEGTRSGGSMRMVPHPLVVLNHPADAQGQTAFGVALLLDAWERAGTHKHPGPFGAWSIELGHALHSGSKLRIEVGTAALGDRLTHIGLDHRLRRELGENPKPGTLAEMGLMQPHEQWWRFDARKHGGAFVEWDRNGKFIGSAGMPGGVCNVPALATITDSKEGLQATVDEVTS